MTDDATDPRDQYLTPSENERRSRLDADGLEQMRKAAESRHKHRPKGLGEILGIGGDDAEDSES